MTRMGPHGGPGDPLCGRRWRRGVWTHASAAGDVCRPLMQQPPLLMAVLLLMADPATHADGSILCGGRARPPPPIAARPGIGRAAVLGAHTPMAIAGLTLGHGTDCQLLISVGESRSYCQQNHR